MIKLRNKLIQNIISTLLSQDKDAILRICKSQAVNHRNNNNVTKDNINSNIGDLITSKLINVSMIIVINQINRTTHNLVKSVFVKYQYKASNVNKIQAPANALTILADVYVYNIPVIPTHSNIANIKVNIASAA